MEARLGELMPDQLRKCFIRKNSHGLYGTILHILHYWFIAERDVGDCCVARALLRYGV